MESKEIRGYKGFDSDLKSFTSAKIHLTYSTTMLRPTKKE